MQYVRAAGIWGMGQGVVCFWYVWARGVHSVSKHKVFGAHQGTELCCGSHDTRHLGHERALAFGHQRSMVVQGVQWGLWG
jgi:hypothetical protein